VDDFIQCAAFVPLLIPMAMKITKRTINKKYKHLHLSAT